MSGIDATAGKFKVDVDGPYPMWITLSVCGFEAFRIDHRDLPDLMFVLNRARQKMKPVLGRAEHEVE